ncbi:uncharacterized protein LOC104895466 isoform X1 [Beta vulgaris subsp. vulgaris]|uniref:uncharacterized protein LOC104895466 isoform X1 n=1 Tax=Beta vulgaris subsp. vulgaris TaxID=3555 RepID=UPI002036F595|nr:uncharacterized protein LOC104895466 isoform X1 [Beta vulgaris subsp. vulgaris]
MGIGMGIGSHGPLIELSAACCHVGELVQLIVFVHCSTPVQGKSSVNSKSCKVVRTDLKVGDESRPYFFISLWNSHIPKASSVSAGDFLFLRNVQVMEFRAMVEARSVPYSSFLPLIHTYTYSSLLSPGVDDLVTSCPLVETAKEKLRRVIHWVRVNQTSSLPRTTLSNQTPASPNWKVHKQEKPRDCLLLSQVLALSAPCKAVFHASIGEVLLQSLPLVLEKERRFLSRRLVTKTDIIVEDMISTGCQLCGLPLCSDSTSVGKDSPLYCGKSSNRLHIVGFIYRPFMLYVWDKSEYIPLLVTNKAAELLFGNITAEKVYLSYKDDQKDPQKLKNPVKAHVNVQDSVKVEEKRIESSPSVGAMGLETRRNYNDSRSRNFYLIWLIVLKMLLLQGKNSLLKFEAHVNPSLEPEDGRFQMITVSMPCSNYKKSSDI